MKTFDPIKGFLSLFIHVTGYKVTSQTVAGLFFTLKLGSVCTLLYSTLHVS